MTGIQGSTSSGSSPEDSCSTSIPEGCFHPIWAGKILRKTPFPPHMARPPRLISMPPPPLRSSLGKASQASTDSKAQRAQALESDRLHFQIQVPAPPLLNCKPHSWHVPGLSASTRPKQADTGEGAVTLEPKVRGLEHHCPADSRPWHPSVSSPRGRAVLGPP